MSQFTIKSRLRRSLPKPILHMRLLILGIVRLSRSEKRECNVCGFVGRFWPFGDPPRRAVSCGNCGCVERHRLVALWISRNPGVVEEAGILHFAPEPGLASIFRARSSNYRSADLNPNVADMVLNIEAIDLNDESVDVVVASHVLEHVDDAKALSEIHRILKPGGSAVLLFPIVEGWDRTYENSLHVSESARTTYYGQFDHVRMYGRDARTRITDAGFRITEFTAEAEDVARYGLSRGEKVFIAVKDQDATSEVSRLAAGDT